MTRYYEPDLSSDIDSPFARDATNKLVRRSYWTDMSDQTLVMVMTKGIGAHLTNEQKRAHLADLGRQARAFVEANCDWDAIVDELEALLERHVQVGARP